jgi:hypothetical protein
MKITNDQLEVLQRQTEQFLELMKRGNFSDARLISSSLESATYVLDPEWLKGYAARQGVKL